MFEAVEGGGSGFGPWTAVEDDVVSLRPHCRLEGEWDTLTEDGQLGLEKGSPGYPFDLYLPSKRSATSRIRPRVSTGHTGT